MKAENIKFTTSISAQNAIIEEILRETQKLEEELRNDPSKQNSLALYDELHQLQKQKSDLEEETNNTLSVPEEIERLTQKVKATNSEITDIETKTSASLDRINKIREQLSVIEKQMSETKSKSIIDVDVGVMF